MPATRREFLGMGGMTLALAGAAVVFDSTAVAHVAAQQGSPSLPTVHDPDLHLLNRLSYGVTPDELAHIRAIGRDAYLEAQLHPESIDDSAMDALLAQQPILFLSRRDVYALGFTGRAHLALPHGMVTRASFSRRQLFERMVEFWTDHFNVPMDDLAPDLIVMQREVIRRHALGRFRDLLHGVAQSPAMLYYLDNTYSTREHPNENYARELLELHTLGVDGGYTEADVQAAARALTGWRVEDATESGFIFDPSMHDTEPKTILGHTMPAGRGIEDGLHLLSLLASHEATSRYLSRKLCVRFVADNPPDSLVDSTAQVWRETDGSIVPVLRHILTSAEFYAAAGQKLRRPLDVFIGAMRATGTSFVLPYAMYEPLTSLSQVPYSWGPPDGYPDVAAAWLNTSGLMARWNTAMFFTHRALADAEMLMLTEIPQRIGRPATVGELVDTIAFHVFGAPLNEAERAVYLAFASETGDPNEPVTNRLLADKLGTLYGLMLASPQYQWR
jgi:uncharacterized protein (DUF1800 family)